MYRASPAPARSLPSIFRTAIPISACSTSFLLSYIYYSSALIPSFHRPDAIDRASATRTPELHTWHQSTGTMIIVLDYGTKAFREQIYKGHRQVSDKSKW